MTFPHWSKDDEQAIGYFTRMVGEHGIDSKALGWGSRESQLLRFLVLSRVAPLNGASVVDVGCGQADLLAWFQQYSIAVDYTGMDITPAMIETSRKRFPQGRFELRNLVDAPLPSESFDFVLASGLFSLRQAEPFQFLQVMLRNMFAACRKAVAFNSLSSWAPQKDEGEYYADPLETLAFAHTLTPRVVFLHDYHPRDFTIYLYK